MCKYHEPLGFVLLKPVLFLDSQYPIENSIPRNTKFKTDANMRTQNASTLICSPRKLYISHHENKRCVHTIKIYILIQKASLMEVDTIILRLGLGFPQESEGEHSQGSSSCQFINTAAASSNVAVGIPQWSL